MGFYWSTKITENQESISLCIAIGQNPIRNNFYFKSEIGLYFWAMQFKDIIGQDETIRKLIRTVRENRVSHAQLFSGPEGYGGLPLALAYAQYLSCSNPTESDSCGTCASCRKHHKLEHPDLHFAFPVARIPSKSSKPISAEFYPEWREFLQKNPYGTLYDWYVHLEVENKQGGITVEESREVLKTLSLKTYESEFKTLILWMPELLNLSAANKLLKIIEEPPQKTLFILVSQNAEYVLPTIYSRTQMVRVKRIEDESMIDGLRKMGFQESAIQSAVPIAEGDWNRVVSLLEATGDFDQHAEFFIQWMRACFQANGPVLVDFTNRAAAMGRESQKNFLRYSLSVIRDAFLTGYNMPDFSRMGVDENAFSMEKFGRFIHGENIHALMEEFDRAHYHISRNGNPKIIFLDLSIKVTRALHKKPSYAR